MPPQVSPCRRGARTRTSRDAVKSFPKAPSPSAGDFLTSGPGFARTFHGHRFPGSGSAAAADPVSQQGAGAARWATPGGAPTRFREARKGPCQDPGGRSAPSPQPGLPQRSAACGAALREGTRTCARGSSCSAGVPGRLHWAECGWAARGTLGRRSLERRHAQRRRRTRAARGETQVKPQWGIVTCLR